MSIISFEMRHWRNISFAVLDNRWRQSGALRTKPHLCLQKTLCLQSCTNVLRRWRRTRHACAALWQLAEGLRLASTRYTSACFKPCPPHRCFFCLILSFSTNRCTTSSWHARLFWERKCIPQWTISGQNDDHLYGTRKPFFHVVLGYASHYNIFSCSPISPRRRPGHSEHPSSKHYIPFLVLNFLVCADSSEAEMKNGTHMNHRMCIVEHR